LSSPIKDIIHYYKPLNKELERSIWDSQKEKSKEIVSDKFNVPIDELVEDAGLEIAS
tara:strand:+ start:4134 stop:4304 length:171 start_codon:yes stop_codon:yes gene_type:complete